MRTLANRESEEVVNNTLLQLRSRLQRSISPGSNLAHSRRIEIYNRYASYELLAHWLAYALPQGFTVGYNVCKVLDDDGIARYYHPIKLLTKNPGLLAYVLLPHDTANENSRMHIAFVGTSNLSGVERDLEYGGAGQESFYAEREGILQQINDMVATVQARTNQKVRILISGHSLGGSDAQNCAALIIKAIAQNVDEQRFGYFYEEKDILPLRVRKDLWHVESVDVAHLNSAGVSEQTAKECDYDSKIAVTCTDLKINMHVLRVKNDLVHTTGQARIFANADPKVAKVELICFAIYNNLAYSPLTFIKSLRSILMESLITLGYSGVNLAQAHSAFHFTTASQHEAIEYYNNSSIQGRQKVYELLSERSYIENSLPIAIIKSGLHKMLKSYNG